jgi:hypothetical protein
VGDHPGEPVAALIIDDQGDCPGRLVSMYVAVVVDVVKERVDWSLMYTAGRGTLLSPSISSMLNHGRPYLYCPVILIAGVLMEVSILG